MLNKQSPIPLYYQLMEDIRAQITSGEIKAGDKLPSESQMMEQYGVSRLTVREALSNLVNEGLLVKKHGKDTYCRDEGKKDVHLNIDVLLNTKNEYFIPYYVRGISEVLTQNDANFIIHDTHNDPEVIAQIIRRVVERGTDGLIIQPDLKSTVLSDFVKDSFALLDEKNVPYIMVGSNYPGLDCSCVTLDEIEGSRAAVRSLVLGGHKHICGIYRGAIRDSMIRASGYEVEMRSSRLTPHVYLIEEDDSDLEKIVDAILADIPNVTGIVCHNDEVALATVRYLWSLGKKVPEDISVIGFDNSLLATRSDIAMTTIIHPKDRMGRLAASKLLEIIKDGEKFQYKYVPQLVQRDSSRDII